MSRGDAIMSSCEACQRLITEDEANKYFGHCRDCDRELAELEEEEADGLTLLDDEDDDDEEDTHDPEDDEDEFF